MVLAVSVCGSVDWRRDEIKLTRHVFIIRIACISLCFLLLLLLFRTLPFQAPLLSLNQSRCINIISVATSAAISRAEFIFGGSVVMS